MIDTNEGLQGNVIRLARVVHSHADNHCVDLVYLDDDSRETGVQVLAPFATTNTGRVDLPEPTQPPSGEWSPELSGGRDMLAVVAMAGMVPIVMGFLYPQVCQMLFDPAQYPNLHVDRHASDVHQIITGQGDTEFWHPSGTFIKIGSTPDHMDLTGKDFDGKWSVGGSPAAHFKLSVNGDQTFVHVKPGGETYVKSINKITVKSEVNVTVIAPRIDLNPDKD